jgi:hypothetical protein
MRVYHLLSLCCPLSLVDIGFESLVKMESIRGNRTLPTLDLKGGNINSTIFSDVELACKRHYGLKLLYSYKLYSPYSISNPSKMRTSQLSSSQVKILESGRGVLNIN